MFRYHSDDEDTRPVLCNCDACGYPIRVDDEIFDFGNGDKIHWDCTQEWIEKHATRREVEEEEIYG